MFFRLNKDKIKFAVMFYLLFYERGVGLKNKHIQDYQNDLIYFNHRRKTPLSTTLVNYIETAMLGNL